MESSKTPPQDSKMFAARHRRYDSNIDLLSCWNDAAMPRSDVHGNVLELAKSPTFATMLGKNNHCVDLTSSQSERDFSAWAISDGGSLRRSMNSGQDTDDDIS